MHNLAVHLLQGGEVVWDYMGEFSHEGIGEIVDEGISFNFSFEGQLTSTQIDSFLFKSLSKTKIDWLSYENKKWIFFSEKFKSEFPKFQKESWLTGTAILTPEFEYSSKIIFNEKRESTKIKLMVTPELIQRHVEKIFLSHKNMNQIPWVRIYNILFKLINKQGENSYFSGSRFINLVREFDDAFPNYTQFLQERAGKSTSRKDYFYDILISFQESVRLNIIKRILEEIEAENKKEVSEIRKMINENDMYDTVFISYGGSDQEIAAKINLHLRSKGIKTWFFPDNALPGEKLHRMMHEGVNNHDRVLFICSEQSLKRPGVLNELERVLEREAKEGGSKILLPIRLDDYVLTNWAPERRDIADQVRSRVITKISIDLPESELMPQLEKIVLALSKNKD